MWRAEIKELETQIRALQITVNNLENHKHCRQCKKVIINPCNAPFWWLSLSVEDYDINCYDKSICLDCVTKACLKRLDNKK